MTTRNGPSTVTNFTVADENYGSGGKFVNWIQVDKWGPADAVTRSLKKGTVVFVSETLKLEEYEGPSGRKSSMKLTASSLKFGTTSSIQRDATQENETIVEGPSAETNESLPRGGEEEEASGSGEVESEVVPRKRLRVRGKK